MAYSQTKRPDGLNPGPDLSTGYYPQTKKPFDVRTVVDTVANMYKIMQTYPGMRVTVLGAMVMNGNTETYPNYSDWVCIADRIPNGGGNTTGSQDWVQVVGGFAANTQYKGAYDAAADNPPLKDDAGQGSANRSILVPGDWYRVSTAQTGITNLDGITELSVNDSIFWNGETFNLFQYSDPTARQPLFDDTEYNSFQSTVQNIIYSYGIRDWSDEAISTGEVRLHKYTLGGKNIVDMYQAVTYMNVDDNNLPTTRSNPPGVDNVKWLLIGSTAGGGGGKLDDTIGIKATAGVPTTRSDAYLSPQEIDARIAQYGGKSTLIQGGTATSFTGPSLTESAKA